MTTTDRTRYVMVSSQGLTQETTKITALMALADGEAESVLVMQADKDGGVSVIKWSLVETPP